MSSTQTVFDQINAAWLGYNEDGEVEQGRDLKKICEHFGVTEEWYRKQWSEQTGGLVSGMVDCNPALKELQVIAAGILSNPNLMVAGVRFDRLGSNGHLSIKAMIDAESEADSIKVSQRSYDIDSNGHARCLFNTEHEFSDSQDAFDFCDALVTK